MGDEELEKLMEAWAEKETASAPELRPTAEMYRLVRLKGQRKPRPFVFSRPALAAAGLAGLVLVVVLLVVVMGPRVFPDLVPGQHVAYVGLREGPVGDGGIVVKEPVVPKGPGKGQQPFSRLWFQIWRQDLPYVESVDLQVPQEEVVRLTPADNYRLLLEPLEARHVYVFQETAAGILARLFPNEGYTTLQNPLAAGQAAYLPAEPNWFYLGEEKGEERLYVVASAQPMQELEAQYARYSQAEDEVEKQALLASLLETLATVEEARPEAGGWVFVLERQ